MKNTALPDWPEVLRQEQAAIFVGVSVNTFRDMVREGRMPAAITLTRSIKGWRRSALLRRLDEIEQESLTVNEWDEP